MTELENKAILHDIYYESFKNGEVKKMLKVLEQTNAKISLKIKATKNIATKERYKALAKYIRETAKETRQQFDDVLSVDDVIESELVMQEKMLKHSMPNNTALTIPTIKQIKQTVVFAPYAGTNYDKFLDDISTGLFDTWDNAVRTGYLMGQNTKSIVRDVMGSVDGLNIGAINRLRNSVNTQTRTFLQMLAAETRKEMYRQNDSLFDGYKYLATLDRRTCLICAECDGIIYKKLDKIPEVPQHYNCRCTVVPYIKGMEQIDTKRASEGKEVNGKVTYNQWLAVQPESVKMEILGEARYRMYKENPSVIKEFVNNGKIKTLAELRA